MGTISPLVRTDADASRFGLLISRADKVGTMLPPPLAAVGSELLRPETRINIGRKRLITFPSLKWYVTDNASILGQSVVISARNEVVESTVPPGQLARYRSPSAGNGRSLELPVNGSRNIRGTSVVLPVTSPSMSHFLFEGLSHLGSDVSDVNTVIITTSQQADFGELVKLALGSRVEVLFRSPDAVEEAWILERAYVPIYRFSFHSAMIGAVENIVAGCRKSGQLGGNLLYISRRDVSRYRMMLNEDRIIELLTRLGFEILQLINMPEAEIVRRFSSARMIVGPMGAGLYNSIFSPPGCVVLALCAPNYIRSFLDQCAALRGIRPAYCFGPDFLSYEAEQRGGHNDFVVDEDAVIETVVTLLERAIPAQS